MDDVFSKDLAMESRQLEKNLSNLTVSGVNTSESGVVDEQISPEGSSEICSYVIFDGNNWCKLRRDLPRPKPDEIESRFSTVPVGTATFC